jgi:GT2 family glycosyltransferase
MTDKPIAVIIPIHNSGKEFIVDCLRYLLNSTEYPIEIYLIESESTDGSSELCDELAKDYKNIKVFHIPKKGLANAVNFGITHSGDLDVYLTQPDVIHQRLYSYDWLRHAVNLSKRYDLGVMPTMNAGGISGPDYIDGMNWFGTWSVFITRETINKVGLFDEEFSPGDDIDFTYRCNLAGIKMVNLPFWFEHHRLTKHIGDDPKLQDEMAHKFRKKWRLGEYK